MKPRVKYNWEKALFMVGRNPHNPINRKKAFNFCLAYDIKKHGSRTEPGIQQFYDLSHVEQP